MTRSQRSTPPRAASTRRGAAARTRPALTGRALVLGALVVLLVIVLAAPVTRYLGSRSDVGTAATQLRQDRTQLRRLTHLQQQYGDPGYIQQQARDTLQYAMPGDTVYVVTDKGATSDLARSSGSGHSTPPKGRTWNTRIWDSVRAADR